MTKFLDSFHTFSQNITDTLKAEQEIGQYLLISKILGVEFNDSWFFCYQFSMDIKQVYITKVENFVDFGDVYLSFIFNLLANSLQIKSSVEKMIKFNKLYDTGGEMKELGVILRIVADFDSYQT